ncbi:hypothetical protein AAC387_Pa01g2448 [Persea americana]
MESWLLLESGLKPLLLLPETRVTHLSNPSFRPTFSSYSPTANFNAKVASLMCRSGVSGRRDWALKVSAPPYAAPVTKEKVEAISPERKEMGKFDPVAPPPFTIGEIRAAIPKHCWAKNPWLSMSYVIWSIDRRRIGYHHLGSCLVHRKGDRCYCLKLPPSASPPLLPEQSASKEIGIALSLRQQNPFPRSLLPFLNSPFSALALIENYPSVWAFRIQHDLAHQTAMDLSPSDHMGFPP